MGLTSPIRIRPATDADAEDAARLYGSACREFEGVPLDPAEIVSRLVTASDMVLLAIPDDPFVENAAGLLACHAGRQSGKACVVIDTLWVAPGFRRRGAGAGLLQGVLTGTHVPSAASGTSRVVLDIPVDNSSLKSLCLSLGMSRAEAPCRYAFARGPSR